MPLLLLNLLPLAVLARLAPQLQQRSCWHQDHSLTLFSMGFEGDEAAHGELWLASRHLALMVPSHNRGTLTVTPMIHKRDTRQQTFGAWQFPS
jgi:hypothetical protein